MLVIDWPSREVPETLARAGFQVIVRGGPGPEDFSIFEAGAAGEITVRRTGRAPETADLVYSYRPLSELGGIIAVAQQLRAKIIWTQSGLSGPGVKDPKGCWLSDEEREAARAMVESAGMRYVSGPYILEAL